MQSKHVQSSDSLRVCQCRSWHNERQGHLTHNHITTCAFSSILLLYIIPRERNTMFMDVLCTTPDTSPHMFHWICPWFWFMKFIKLFLLFCAKIDWQFSVLPIISTLLCRTYKKLFKAERGLVKLLSVSAAAGLLVAFETNFFISYFTPS